MDKYTEQNKTWLENQFKNCDERGIYYAHQPIYGFRRGHSEPGRTGKYIKTYHIMSVLSHLEFDSLVDIGGAEGYKAYIANQLFNIHVNNSDLSEEACKRAKDIFQIESICADIHELPFKNNGFDVVLCSQTLEHVARLHKAIGELVRVASKAVVITVPHEPKEVIDKNIEERTPHAHIHSFDLDSFNFLRTDGYHTVSRKMVSSFLTIPTALLEAMPADSDGTRYPKILLHIYNACVPILRKLFGKNAAAFLIRLDAFVCRFTASYNAAIVLILKDSRYWRKQGIRNIEPYQIIDYTVPYHYLKKQ